MPVSYMGNVTPIMMEIARLQPETILDAGVGFGKMGLLCRELLDIQPERYKRSEWKTHILGVEGFEQYRNPIHDYAYDEVRYEDFTQNEYSGFDLVLMIDSLEHIAKSIGHKVLDGFLLRNKHVIVSCPTGVNYLPQIAVHGNEFERHRAHWEESDFEVRGGKTINKGVCIVSSIPGWKEIKWRNS